MLIKADPAEILRTINTMYASYPVIELRAINTATNRKEAGYFDQASHHILVDDAERLSNAGYQIYIVANEINPVLLARSQNRMSKANHTATDVDVVRRRWILIDIDAKRPAGVSATDAEKTACWTVATAIQNWLRMTDCWPEAMFCDSGNGYHLNYETDLPNDDESRNLIRAVLKILADKFNCAGATVDQAVFNAARIWKGYGTVAQKGDSTADRPHRMAHIINDPDIRCAVPIEALRAFVAGFGPQPPPAKAAKPSGQISKPPDDVNAEALANLGTWVPQLFPDAKLHAGGIYRVTSKSLGRDLEEDLSLAPNGIRDFGEEGPGLTAIDVVMRHLPCTKPSEAFLWLRERLGMEAFKPALAKPPEQHNKPPDKKKDGEPNAHSRASRFLNFTEFMNEWESPLWLVDGIIQRGCLYGMTAPFNHGKTAVAIELSTCVAIGNVFADCEVTRGRVLYLIGENPPNVLERMMATAQCHDASWEELSPWFSIYKGADNLTAMLGETEAYCEKIGDLSLVIVDTSAAYSEMLNENDNTEALNHAKALRNLVTLPGAPAVVVLCHPNKNAARDSLYPRGGSAFINELDANLTCWLDDPVITLDYNKIRGPAFHPKNFELRNEVIKNKLDRKGHLINQPVLIFDGKDEFSASSERNGRLIQLAICINSYPGKSDIWYASTLKWVDGNGDPAKMKVGRDIKELKKRGIIESNNLGAWELTTKGNAAVFGKKKSGKTP